MSSAQSAPPAAGSTAHTGTPPVALQAMLDPAPFPATGVPDIASPIPSAAHAGIVSADPTRPTAPQLPQSALTGTMQMLAAGHPTRIPDIDPASRPQAAGNVAALPAAAAREASLRPFAEEDSELARLLNRQEPDRQPSLPRPSNMPVPTTQTAPPAVVQADHPDAGQTPIRIPAEILAAVVTAESPAGAPADSATSSLSALHAYGGEASLASGHEATRLDSTLRHLVAATARPDIQAVALRIAQKSADGASRFEIELDPPELGRVEVRLEFGRDGQVKTHMLVDRADTLDALLRDSRGLERALNASGLKLEGGIQYELRDQSSFAQSHSGRDHEGDGATRAEAGSDETADPANPAPLPQRNSYAGGLDLRI